MYGVREISVVVKQTSTEGESEIEGWKKQSSSRNRQQETTRREQRIFAHLIINTIFCRFFCSHVCCNVCMCGDVV